MVSVSLKNVTKQFGSHKVVDDLNLEIQDKEFFVLLGPSGCGKSTTLNMIAGLEEVTDGIIYFGEEIMNSKPPDKRNVAMVFQGFALYPFKTAYENIAFPLRLRKTPKDEIDRRVKDVASILKITHLLERKPYEMSGGERQRVGLARAMVRNPQVFLLDEPLSNIDAKLRVMMRTELIRLHKELNTTMIYVTHDQVEAMTMADRIAVMSNGKILQIGEPIDVFNKPSSIFIGGFIGSPPMNFIDCSLVQKDSQTSLQAGPFSLKIPNELGKTIKDQSSGSELIFGVRPRAVIVSREKTEEEQLESEVYAVEPLGEETIVDLNINGLIIKAVTDPVFEVKMGEKIWVGFNRSKIHIFDKNTEKLLV